MLAGYSNPGFHWFESQSSNVFAWHIWRSHNRRYKTDWTQSTISLTMVLLWAVPSTSLGFLPAAWTPVWKAGWNPPAAIKQQVSIEVWSEACYMPYASKMMAHARKGRVDLLMIINWEIVKKNGSRDSMVWAEVVPCLHIRWHEACFNTTSLLPWLV